VTFTAEVVVTLKPVVNDPQGITVRDGLTRLGYVGVTSVRVGKHIQIDVEAADEQAARALVVEISERLLRNPVIEDYQIAGVEARTAAA